VNVGRFDVQPMAEVFGRVMEHHAVDGLPEFYLISSSSAGETSKSVDSEMSNEVSR
jgi:hypothetical protein